MQPKSLTIDPRIPAEMLGVVHAAEAALERVLDDAADEVEVAWSVGAQTDEGEPTVRLTLTEEDVTRSGDFSEWDLSDGIQLRRRLRRVWDDVLKERIKFLLKSVNESLALSGAE